MRDLARFVVPSAIGVFCFLTPVKVSGTWTIPLGVLIDRANDLLADYLVGAALVILTLSAVLSPWFTWNGAPDGSLRRRLFVVKPAWIALRIFAALLAWVTVTRFGPEFLWSEKTGGAVVHDLASVILTVFLFACLLLPFLTDFGLMELVGTLLRNVFRRVFRLPGRSAIDALASWLSAAAVGVLLTSQQYAGGFYSGREASVIATNFSVVSLPFALLIANVIGIGHLFVPYYATVCVAGLVCALVVPRLPPLSRIPDDYYPEVGKQIAEEVPEGVSLWSQGLEQALARARNAPSVLELARSSMANVLDIWFALTPGVIAVGGIGLIVAEYTPVMDHLSYPFVFVLDAMRIPEASAAAPAFLVGFLEMFLPAVLASGIESELTRFVVACLSIVQLIYMSEVGILLLQSPIPLHLGHLVVIFLLRTAVALPVVAFVAHWVVF